MAILKSLKGPATVRWVRQGIVIESQEIVLGCPGAVVVAQADQLVADASGFKLIDNDAYKAYVDDLRRKVKSLLGPVGIQGHRGRNRGCPRPPAQIRTGAANAYGSYLG